MPHLHGENMCHGEGIFPDCTVEVLIPTTSIMGNHLKLCRYFQIIFNTFLIANVLPNGTRRNINKGEII